MRAQLVLLAAVVGVVACRDEPAPSARSAMTPRPSRAVDLDDVVLDVRADDPALVAARARAQREIDGVLERHAREPLKELSVKAPITDGIHVEQVWLADVRYEAGVFSGTIDNDPTRVKTRRVGELVRVKKDEITDFMYEEGDKIWDNATRRPPRDRLPP